MGSARPDLVGFPAVADHYSADAFSKGSERDRRAIALCETQGVRPADFLGERGSFGEICGDFGGGVGVGIDEQRDACGVREF